MPHNFLGLLGMIIVNEYFVYKENNASFPLLEFKRELAKELITFAKDCGPRGTPKLREIVYSIGLATLRSTAINYLGKEEGVKYALKKK